MVALIRQVNADQRDGAGELYGLVMGALATMVLVTATEAERYSRGAWGLRAYLWSVRMRGQVLPKGA